MQELTKETHHHSHEEHQNYHHKIIVVVTKSKPIRIHTILFREVLMAIGYNQKIAMKITMKTFKHFFKEDEKSEEVIISKQQFTDYLTEIHAKNKLEIIRRLSPYFYAIIRLHSKQKGLIILLGGASGCGKSSLTSLLAGRLHLKEMSSDNIRHIMRNFISKQESPFIFSSTYDSYHLIKDESMSLEARTIEAYLRQCREVQRELKKVLDYYYQNGVWVIVEGVHITPEFIIECMKSYESCFGSVIYIEDAEKYKNRFAARSSKNSIKPEDNKYIQSFDKIMMIQNYLTKEAELRKIPTINNTNLDTSVSLIHRSFLKNFKIMSRSKALITNDAETAEMFHEEFMKTKAMLSKAKKIKEYIKLGQVIQDEPAPEIKHRKSSIYEADEDGAVVLGKIKELKPVSSDNKKDILVMPKNVPKGLIKAVTKMIRSQKPDDPEKVHWVDTNRRSIIFKTDESHKCDQFLYDYVLEKAEKVERVTTDAVSDEKIFKEAMQEPDLKVKSQVKSMKKIKRSGSKDSDNKSFESEKRRIPQKSSEVIASSGELIDVNHQAHENSIDNIDSDGSANKEVNKY